MFKILTRLVDSNEKNLRSLRKELSKINGFEAKLEKLSDAQLKAKTGEFREFLEAKFQKLSDVELAAKANMSNTSFGKSFVGVGRETIFPDSPSWKYQLEAILPEAFAVVREAARRTVGERTWDEQMLCATALHRGMAAELKTGEGKTLVAVHALYLNALTGHGTHLVTVNDYLSRIQAEGMALIFNFLGLTVGCLNQDKSYLIDASKKLVKKYANYSQADGSNLIEVTRRQAYEADVTYGTNSEFGFDYLRDNLVWDGGQMVQSNPKGEVGAHHFTIVDEVDSILVDEARTPLIISQASGEATERYGQVAHLIKDLVLSTDYEVEEKHKTASLTELGIRKLERMFKVDNLYEKDFQLVHLVEQSLKAHTLFHKNKDYIVKDGEVVIVDEFTGRLKPGHRYSEGLHQAIEAKEGVPIKQESKTVATTSFQNYFRMYEKLSGMSGTVVTEAEEFFKIYKLEAVSIPTHKPVIRRDRTDLIFKSEAGKWRAVMEDIVKHHEAGQPVLVGTTSVEKNELLGSYLKRKGIRHEILNAKQHDEEGRIIAEAGRIGAVTIATNMAGRGVDIILGGTKPMDEAKLEEWQKHHEKVLELEGLYVIGTERHESRRIDNQLRGRSGRHGEPGESRFYISLQDDLMRVFGGGAVEKVMGHLGLDENTPIEAGMVAKSIEQAQKRVEGMNFDYRKHVVEYDDVLDAQRKIVYGVRKRLLGVSEIFSPQPSNHSAIQPLSSSLDWIKNQVLKAGLGVEIWQEKLERVGEQNWGLILRQVALPVLDTLWMEHLTTMDDLREGVGLQAYGQKDPLVEYRQEGRAMFERLLGEAWATVAERLDKVQIEIKSQSGGQGITSEVKGFPTSEVGELAAAKVARGLQFKHAEPELGVAEEAKAFLGKQVAQEKQGMQGMGNLKLNLSDQQESASGQRPPKVGRNDPCPCGSGKKYKRCHGR